MGNSLGTKLYYSIGEVADLTSLAPYTLRAWEGEFACLRPKRVRGKNRAYRERDIAIILLIRRLLHEERYSTRGAQQRLRNEPELIRGAVEHVARLCSDNPPGLDELMASGRGDDVPRDEPSTSRSPAEEAPPPQVETPQPALEDGQDTKQLLLLVRQELRDILQLFR